MIANKKPRTSYAELPQEIKDKHNKVRRELESKLEGMARDKHNERRRLAYAKKANICPHIRKSKKAKCDKLCVEATQIAHPKNLEIIVEKIPDGIISMDQNSMQTSVVHVVGRVPSTVLRIMSNVECNEQRRLLSVDPASVSVDIPISNRDRSNDYSARSADRIGSKVAIEEAAVQTMLTDENCMQSCVVGVLREVSQTSIHYSTTSVNEIGSSSHVVGAIEKRPSIIVKLKLK
ncbi:hypothetical protein RHMOL_Rhmol11G0075600 [Rhododendron molle]|uniref:Uncharacterized protein n=1 Tax=Rhododendron molle TaxID=49168 RepID=A0ACC0LPD0_RHOML|nr:hypothetical protein RHMOL_Rhmol11G0075600 [Rhododendron molle]